MSDNLLSTPLIGHRYLLLEELGAGGMGRVYKSYDRLTGQLVALKHVYFPSNPLQGASRVSSTSDSRLALAREFQTLASFRHPNIISVMDYGFDAGRHPFFTMTLLDKARSIVEEGAEQPLFEQVHLLLQLLEALVYIHRRQILHRDLKPGNVLVQDGQVYVLDFGLAVDVSYSDADHLSGTLAYLAPEVLAGEPSSVASDLYGVGLLAYKIFSGHLPYDVGDTPAMVQDILNMAVDVTSLEIPPEMMLVLARLLAKQPEHRYQSAEEVTTALYNASGQAIPGEAVEIRESFLQAAQFVGREREKQTLVEALDKVLNGKGSSWLVGGESGVGKSRLIDEVRIRALVNGMLVLRGQGIREAHSPYLLLHDVLRHLVLNIHPTDEELPLLRLLIPDVETLLDREAVPLPDMDASVLQQRLELTVEQCFRQVLAEQPVMLILEDLQWAQNSLPLIAGLNQLTAELPLLIIGSYREEESPALPDHLPEMRTITLQRLGDTQIAALSRAMLGRAGERPQVIELLQRETEGNVFFLVEVVRALSEEAGRMSAVGLTTLPERVFAGGMRRILERRIHLVPQWAQSTLQLAAVLGRQIDKQLLAYAEPDLDMEAWITVCANAAVLDSQDGRWRFAHDKLREAILEQLSAPASTALHRRSAEAIEQVYPQRLDEFAVVLAEQWAQAGDTAKEGYYSKIAAEQMLDASDFHTAKRLTLRALELRIYEAAENAEQVLAELQHQLGRAHYGLGEYKEASRWYQSALPLFQKLGDQRNIAYTLGSLSELDFRQGRYQQAKPVAEQSLAIAREVGFHRQVGYSLMNLGVIAAGDGDLLEAKALFEECLACMKEIGEPISIARALNNLALAHDLLGDIAGARLLHTQALTIRRRINDRHGIAYSLSNLAALAEIEGNYDTARRWLQEALTILRSIGEKMSVATALAQLGKVALKTGGLVSAQQYAHESLALRRELDDADSIAVSLTDLGDIAQARGDYETAWHYYRQALQTAKEAGLDNRSVNTLIQIARLHKELKRPESALELLLLAQRFNQSRHIPTDSFEVLIGDLRLLLPADAASAIERQTESASLESVVNRLLSEN